MVPCDLLIPLNVSRNTYTPPYHDCLVQRNSLVIAQGCHKIPSSLDYSLNLPEGIYISDKQNLGVTIGVIKVVTR